MINNKGKNNHNYIDGRTNRVKYCMKCGKKLAKLAFYLGFKRCRKCSRTKMVRNKLRKANLGKYPSLKTRIKMSIAKKNSKKFKEFIKHRDLKGKKNGMYGVHRFGKRNPNYNNHKLNGNTLEKHHIDLNRNNNKNKNILKLSLKYHRRLHLYAYHYLVRRGLIKKYIKWFFRYKIKEIKMNDMTEVKYFEVMPGAVINEVAKEAIFLAKRYNCLITFEFNDVKLRVYRFMREKEIVNEYYQEFNKKSIKQ